MNKVIFILFIAISYQLSTINYSSAQDINCNVSVTTPQIQQTDKKIYETLQKAINEFVKNRKWTNYNFKVEERIECNMLINITERVSTNEFKGTIQVQARRPIYKTSYNSVLLNLIDKDLQFKYEEFQPLDFDETTHISNLTSVLAYYIYVIIGLDFDTFSLYGGTPFYNTAQTIINNAQNAPEKGWKSFESKRNRYWLVENILNQSYQPFREALYKYHRRGLDVMYENMLKGRQEVLESLELLRKVNREKPGLHIVNTYMFGKVEELVNIFSEAPQNEKEQASKALKEVDPANSSKYSAIMDKKP
jgi:hypothetical protein